MGVATMVESMYLYLFHYVKHYRVLKTPRIFSDSDFWSAFCNRGYVKIQALLWM